MVAVRSFHKYRGETSFTLQKLVEILKEQLPHVAPLQTKYRVSDIPTERTVRYYTTNFLVDKPLARDGVNALYGYRHLLQILAIKYLQSQYLPLVKVRSLIKNADNRELELLIPAFASAPASSRMVSREDRRIAERSFLSRTPAVDPPLRPTEEATGQVARADALPPDSWHRMEVVPGIELHVQAAALPAERRERLREALLRELEAPRG
jgi:DNA-binding transcriptional MerR regulator